MANELANNIAALVIGVPIIVGMLYIPILALKILSDNSEGTSDEYEVDEIDHESYVTMMNGHRRLDNIGGK